MNERIKELAGQTGIIDVELLNDSQSKMLEKFAELIVKECTMVACPLYMESSKAEVRGMEQLLDKIYEHFGVEE